MLDRGTDAAIVLVYPSPFTQTTEVVDVNTGLTFHRQACGQPQHRSTQLGCRAPATASVADHFASYTGTAPLDASSGDQIRHRLNTGGNRQLNSALHTIAVCQARDPGPGQLYFQRKLAENKTENEARRALKRRLANIIYRHIRRDQQRCFPLAA